MRIELDPAEVRHLDRLINEPMYWTTNHKSGSEAWVRTTEAEGYVIDFKVCTPLRSSYDDDDLNSTCWCEAVVFERSGEVLHEVHAEVGDHIVGRWDFIIDNKSFSVEVA